MSVKVLKESGLCCLSEVALVLSTGVTYVLFIRLVRVQCTLISQEKRTSYLICVQQCIFLKIINPHFLWSHMLELASIIKFHYNDGAWLMIVLASFYHDDDDDHHHHHHHYSEGGLSDDRLGVDCPDCHFLPSHLPWMVAGHHHHRHHNCHRHCQHHENDNNDNVITRDHSRYTTAEFLEERSHHPEECLFVVKSSSHKFLRSTLNFSHRVIKSWLHNA